MQTFDALGSKLFRPFWAGDHVPELGMFLLADGGIGFAVAGVLQVELSPNGDVIAFGGLFGNRGVRLTGSTSGVTTILAAAIAGGTLIAPTVSGTDTLATLASAQTFTNKTIDASLNTLLNLPFSFVGPLILPTRIITASATVVMNNTDYEVIINQTTPGAIAVTLPATVTLGRRARVSDGKGDAATNNITINGPINGGTSTVLNANYGWIEFRADGTAWNIAA